MRKQSKDRDFVSKAFYKGGRVAINAFIRTNLKYPEEALREQIEGSVYVEFQIDYNGEVHHPKVLTSVGYGCDEEAVRVISLLKFEVPKKHKQKVGFRRKMNIHFRLNKTAKKDTLATKTPINYHYTYISKEKEDAVTETPSTKFNYNITLESKSH